VLCTFCGVLGDFVTNSAAANAPFGVGDVCLLQMVSSLRAFFDLGCLLVINGVGATHLL